MGRKRAVETGRLTFAASLVAAARSPLCAGISWRKAEGEGFEPSMDRIAHTGFRDRSSPRRPGSARSHRRRRPRWLEPARPGHETGTPPRESRGLARSSRVARPRGCPSWCNGICSRDRRAHPRPLSVRSAAGWNSEPIRGAPLVARSGCRYRQDRRTGRTVVGHPPRAGRVCDPPPAQ